MAMITVLSPEGVSRAATKGMPALPVDLRGLRIGFLDNTKSNFGLLASEIGALLKERFGVKDVVYKKKANASTAAPSETIESMARECDVVFAGSAD